MPKRAMKKAHYTIQSSKPTGPSFYQNSIFSNIQTYLQFATENSEKLNIIVDII